jgi:hypothetical protein
MSELQDRFMEGAAGRWHIQGDVEGPGWWGEGDGFFIETLAKHPGYEDFWLILWVGADHAIVRVMDRHNDEWWLDSDYRMTHEGLLSYLRGLPKPFTEYGANVIEGVAGGE